VWVRLTVAVARHEDVRLAYIVAQVEDLTAERRAVRELAARDERFRLLADDVVVARTRTTPDLPVEYRSRGVEAMIGRRRTSRPIPDCCRSRSTRRTAPSTPD
jgi:PAS domain-containing protein